MNQEPKQQPVEQQPQPQPALPPSYKDRVLAAFAPVEIQQRIQALRGALVELPTLRPLLPPSDDDIAAGHSWFGQPAHSHDHHNGDSTK